MDFQSVIRQLAISAPAILVAITFHEVAHGYIAHRLGDPTAKVMGRLTLNPIAHIDPIGTVLMPVMLLVFTQGQFVFGYAKPVPINPLNFSNPRKGMALSAAAGPLTNIALAIASALVIKLVLAPILAVASAPVVESVLRPLHLMLVSSVVINIVLAAFNLIPIPPLDGGRIVVGLLSERQAITFGRLEPYGMLIVIVLIATGIARLFISPVVKLLLALIGML